MEVEGNRETISKELVNIRQVFSLVLKSKNVLLAFDFFTCILPKLIINATGLRSLIILCRGMVLYCFAKTKQFLYTKINSYQENELLEHLSMNKFYHENCVYKLAEVRLFVLTVTRETNFKQFD